MAQISIKTNIAEVTKEFTALQRRQIPFATFLTVNKLAENSHKSFQISEISKLDRPTRYAQNMMFVNYAKRSVLAEARGGGKPNITSDVRVKDRIVTKRGLVTQKEVMQHLFETGERRGKGIEGYFIRAGFMLRGQFAVPASGAPMDSFGNVDKRFVVQLLSYLRLFNESGFRANVVDRNKFSKRFAARNKISRQSGKFFVIKSNQISKLHPGVWTRLSTGFGKGIRPVYLFVDAAEYRQFLDLDTTVKKVVDRDFTFEFNKAFAHALATAK
jgi:hypothetical protein